MDAALVPSTGKAYFFAGGRHHRYDFDEDRVDKADARIGRSRWKGLATGQHAALVNPVTGLGHFFRGIRHQRFDFAADEVTRDG